MAAEFSANAIQDVLPNQSIIFTENPVHCNRGLVFHRDESGIFLLSSAPVRSYSFMCGCGCGCMSMPEALYEVAFHANIQIPTGGTVEAVSLGIALDGEVDPSSIMTLTPAAVAQLGNVGADIIVAVPAICRCSRVSVRNISTQAIQVQNANIIFDSAGVRR